MAQDALTAQAEIARLKFQLARYRRAEFGRSSEKLAREAEQLELALEALATDQAERLVTASPAVAAAVEAAAEAHKPARRPLPEHLPREDRRHPAPCTCPGCGGALRKIADEVTETLDYVPSRFKVVQHIREKLSCRVCDTVVAAPVPDHAIARGRAGAGLLAHIVVSKYDDHLPLYRQAEIFARDGVSLETSTLSGWVGATAAALKPLVDALAADVLASDTLHVDDTPVPVLAPGTGKTKTGRLWTYVRDERPFAGARPPAALFLYSPDRKGAHPQAHLKPFRGVIHAEGYAGFNELFAGGRIVEAGCWAHYLESDFIWSDRPPRQHSPATTAGGAPDNFVLRGATRRCPREGRCSFPSEHCRASRRTSGTTDGATRDCPFAPCTRQAAARLLVTAVTPEQRHAGCGSPAGTALRVARRSVSCRTFLQR